MFIGSRGLKVFTFSGIRVVSVGNGIRAVGRIVLMFPREDVACMHELG